VSKKRGRPRKNESVRADAPAQHNETDCQPKLPSLIRISSDTVIKDIDFIRAMINRDRAFTPVRKMNQSAVNNMSLQVKAQRPTKEDIDAPRL